MAGRVYKPNASNGSNAYFIAAVDANDFEKSKAYAICDGDNDENDIQGAIDALDSGGIVQLSSGSFYLQDTSLELKQGVTLRGVGLDVTKVLMHPTATFGQERTSSSASGSTSGNELFPAMIVLEDAGYYFGGGLCDLTLQGNGSIVSDFQAQPGGDATVDGVLNNSDLALLYWFVENCKIARLRHGIHSVTQERFVPVTKCQFFYNEVGWRVSEHPLFSGCEFRWNDIGIGGEMFDALIDNCKFTGNNIGVIDEVASHHGVSHCWFQNCIFAGNKTAGVYAGSRTVIGSGCDFNHTNSGYNAEKGVVITQGTVVLNGVNSTTQSDPGVGWEDGIVYLANNVNSVRITGCLFDNPIGPAIAKHPDTTLNSISITNNDFRLFSSNSRILNFASEAVYASSFCDNHIFGYGSLNLGTDALIVIDNYSSARGWSICNNTFWFVSSAVAGYLFDVDLTKSRFVGNRFHNVSGFDGIFKSSGIDSTTILGENIGFVTSNKGEAQIDNGATTEVVAHELDLTPTIVDIQLTPTTTLGSASEFYVSDVGATTFQINVDSNPGQNIKFAWRVGVNDVSNV